MHRPTRLLPLLIILAILLPLTASAQKKKFFARRARVTLHNGSELIGIVRNKKLFEIQRKGLFVPVDLDKLRATYEAAKDAALRANKPAPSSPFSRIGIRLWFVMGNDGYVFLLRRDVKSHKLEKAVDEKEFKLIERRAAARASRRRARRALLEKERKALKARALKAKQDAADTKTKTKTKTAGDKTDKGGGGTLELPKGFKSELKWIEQAKKLLETFPEKAGWGKDKKSYNWLKFKLQRTKGGSTTRTIVVNGVTKKVIIKRGIPRTKIEDEFYRKYDLWVAAGKWNKAGKIYPEKPVKGAKAGAPVVKKPAK